MIQDNIARILDQIEAACRKVERNSSEIILVGVTKFANAAEIKEAVNAGLTHIGENKVQEARKKFSILDDFGGNVTRHMIGHLQTNKVKQVLEIFDCIQSVDSIKLAAAIEKQAAKQNKAIDILIQVNTAEERQKFGIAPSEVFTLIESIAEFDHVHLCGLMAIAPLGKDEEVIRKCFRDLRFLRDQVIQRFSGNDRIAMKYLSMGMTGDFEIAIEEGANMVRIGRAIFQ